MSGIAIALTVVMSLVGAASALGLVLGTIVRTTKNEIIADQKIYIEGQDRRIGQLEGDVERNRQTMAEMQGQIKVMQQAFNQEAIAEISAGVATVVSQMLLEKTIYVESRRLIDQSKGGSDG